MEHEITHSCGHTQKHMIFGQFAADIDRERRRVARGKCTPCYNQARQAKAARDVAVLDGFSLPILRGSEKQVAWADTIRVERLAALHRYDPAAIETFAGVAEAKWWIDHRAVDLKTVSPPS